MFLPSSVSAQGMMGFPNSSPDNAAIQGQQQEEQEGKNFLDELKNKTITCSQLKDANFEKIGEYYMGQSIGDTGRHIAMNEMMKAMMGSSGEEQAHIVMGKRLSGCDASASYSQNGWGFMPMMFMMGGGGNPMTGYGGWGNMMGWGGFGLGWLFMILFWVLIVLGIVALLRWVITRGKTNFTKTPLNILQERYAKGEIDKKEFEEKKKDLKL